MCPSLLHSSTSAVLALSTKLHTENRIAPPASFIQLPFKG